MRCHTERRRAHGFREAGHEPVGHRGGSLGSVIARRQTGPAGRQDQIQLPAVGEGRQCPLDERLVVGDHDRLADLGAQTAQQLL